MANITPTPVLGNSAPEFGSDPNLVSIFSIPLDTPFQNVQYDFGGNVLWAIQSTDRTAQVDVRFQSIRDSNPIPFKEGQFIRGIAFNKLVISNSSAVPGGSITFLVAVEGPRQIQIENPAQLLTEVQIEPGVFNSYPDVSVAATTTAPIAGSNPNRKQIIISNPSANIAYFRIGDGSASATEGLELPPGKILELSANTTIFAYNPTAIAQSVNITELA